MYNSFLSLSLKKQACTDFYSACAKVDALCQGQFNRVICLRHEAFGPILY